MALHLAEIGSWSMWVPERVLTNVQVEQQIKEMHSELVQPRIVRGGERLYSLKTRQALGDLPRRTLMWYRMQWSFR